MKKTLVPIALAFALVAVAPAAFAAGSQPANLTISATVINNCKISTTPVGFSNYDPLSATPNQANGTVVITCTKNAAPTIWLGNGVSYSAPNRRMTDGTNFMNYDLYKPLTNVVGAACAYTTRWGATAGTDDFVPTAAPAGLVARTYNVCGQITAGQDLAAATFNDTVVATVNF
jgi:spore coat protein U-like protein